MAISISPATANIGCGGTINFTVSGDPGPYSANPIITAHGQVLPVGPSTFTFFSLASNGNGTDVITVTDQITGATATFTVTVVGCSAVVPLAITRTGATGNLQCGDQTVLTAVGGSGSYQWDTIDLLFLCTAVISGSGNNTLTINTANPSAIANRPLVVTLRDSENHLIQTTIIYSCQQDNPVLFSSSNPHTCGTINTVNRIGGNAPFTFTHSATGSVVYTAVANAFTLDLYGLGGTGTVTVVITDADGDTDDLTIEVDCTPTQLQADFDDSVDLNCGTTGQINVTGGSPGYTYATLGCVTGVSVDSAGLVSIAAGTPAGSCTIVVTDGAGATANVPVTWVCIPIPPLTLADESVEALCGTDVVAGVSGGTLPYTVAVTPPAAGVVTMQPSGLSAKFVIADNFSGVATVTFTDSSLPAQFVGQAVDVTCAPSPMKVTPSSPKVNCGDPVSISVTGGIAPYVWTSNCGLNVLVAPTTGASVTATTQPGFSGNCQLTVTDSTGQAFDVSITVLCSNEKPRIVGGASILVCNQTQSFSVTGGTAPYTWTSTCLTLLTLTPSGATASVVAGNTSGTCTIKVKDARNNEDTIDVSVICQPAGLASPFYCVPCNLSQQITVSGGAAPYTYSMNTSDCGGKCPPGSVVNGTGRFEAGTEYGACFVKVVDANGKVIYVPVTVICPPTINLPSLFPDILVAPSLNASPKFSLISCGQTSQIIVTGGIEPYSYRVTSPNDLWGNPIGSVSSTGLFSASSDVTGSVFVEITDFSGRKSVLLFVISCAAPCTSCVDC
jgi:hypothetical protein